jgi:hypothetical protein
MAELSLMLSGSGRPLTDERRLGHGRLLPRFNGHLIRQFGECSANSAVRAFSKVVFLADAFDKLWIRK